MRGRAMLHWVFLTLRLVFEDGWSKKKVIIVYFFVMIGELNMINVKEGGREVDVQEITMLQRFARKDTSNVISQTNYSSLRV